MTKPLMYENELIEQLHACLQNAEEFALGMALITQGGLDLVADDLRGCLLRGGIGRILIGIDMPTEPAAIEFLSQLQGEFESQLTLRLFQSSSRRFFHPKLSLFRSLRNRWSAIIGSANLTNGGLANNYEVSIFVDDHRAARGCLDFFEENFRGGHARKIDADWLERCRSSFQLRVKAMKALGKARNRVLHLRAKRTHAKPVSRRIRGFKFGFTGKIEEWPREARLYPLVRKRGGEISDKAGSLASADCLVHGQILGGRKSTYPPRFPRRHRARFRADTGHSCRSGTGRGSRPDTGHGCRADPGAVAETGAVATPQPARLPRQNRPRLPRRHRRG